MTVAVYNPQLLTRDEAVAQFIARRKLLERVLEKLREKTPPHMLFIGTRGMGKTTLLQRIRYAVEDDAGLRARYLPLQFPEEQYAVLSLDTFYLNTLDALSDALEREGNQAGADAVDQAVQEVERARDRKEAALRAIETAAKKAGRLLLLLSDNAERILDDLDEKEQWSLRETLSESKHLVFFGASTQAIASQFTSKKAFYEFFQIEWMNPLLRDEVEELLRELGKESDQSGRVEQWMDQDPARLETLIRLTGGNPRTIVILLGLVLQGDGGDVASELERLLDACTPAYKGRMDDLPAQAQAVLHGVAEHFDPVSAAEVAAKIRVDTTSVSAQLTRLVRMGLVEKTDSEETRVRYQVAERFFNIWYLMRQSRRVRARMRWLVEFLRIFYSREELAARGKELAEQVRNGCAGAERMASIALAHSEALDGPGRAGLELATLRGLLNVESGRRAIAEIIDLTDAGDPLRNRAERLLAHEEAERLVKHARVTAKGWDASEFWRLLGGSWVLTAQEKREVARGLETMTAEEVKALQERLKGPFPGQGSAARFGPFLDLIRHLLATRLITLADGSPEAHEEARAALEELDPATLGPTPEEQRLRALAWGWAELAGDDTVALRTIESATARHDGSATLRHSKGLLYRRLGQSEQAEKAYLEALAIDPRHAYAWTGLGSVCLDGGRTEEAEKAYREALAIDPRYANAWLGLGNVLRDRGRTEEAEKAYREALAIDPRYANAWLGLGNVLRDRGRTEEAEKAYHEALAIDPRYAYAWNGLGNVLRDRGRTEEAEKAYREALAIDPRNGYAWHNLGRLLSPADQKECRENAARFVPNEQWPWERLQSEAAAIERAARGALEDRPGHPMATMYLAAAKAIQHGWAAGAEGIREALPKIGPDHLEAVWWPVEQLSRTAVTAGKAAEMAAILEEAGLAEPWRPWMVALRTAGSQRLADLKLVAPEVREPAEAILRKIAPDLFG